MLCLARRGSGRAANRPDDGRDQRLERSRKLTGQHPEQSRKLTDKEMTEGKGKAVATIRTATARWEGPLDAGKGSVNLDSSGLGSYELTWASRAEAPNGRTSPEELIAAAHSACFSMALAHGLAQGGHPPAAITTSASVSFALPAGITGIQLSVRATVPGISEAEFAAAAEDAKKNCPVSKALAATKIDLSATLET
jgi:osmotically inducible protein OsmC